MTIRDDTLGLYSDTTISAINNASDAQDVGQFTEAVIVINVTATTGSNETLDLDVEISDDQSTWYKLEDVTQLTSGAVKVSHPVTVPFGKFIRLNNPTTPGGTGSPSFTLTASVMVKGG